MIVIKCESLSLFSSTTTYKFLIFNLKLNFGSKRWCLVDDFNNYCWRWRLSLSPLSLHKYIILYNERGILLILYVNLLLLPVMLSLQCYTTTAEKQYPSPIIFSPIQFFISYFYLKIYAMEEVYVRV